MRPGDPELDDRIMRSPPPHLLIACDYDGTIAPLVDDPMTAAAQTSVALQASPHWRRPASPSSPAARCETSPHSAASGRDPPRRLPRQRVRHRFRADLDPELQERRSELPVPLANSSPIIPSSRSRRNRRRSPFTTAHSTMTRARPSSPRSSGSASRRSAFVSARSAQLAAHPDRQGKALSTVRATVGATAVLFLGDDVTDEYAFAHSTAPMSA